MSLRPLYECTPLGEDPGKYYDVVHMAAQAVAAGLSIHGAAFVLVQYMYRSRGHTVSRMVALLALSDLLASLIQVFVSFTLVVSNLVADTGPGWPLAACAVVRSTYDFWIHVSQMWTIVIAMFLLVALSCFPTVLMGGSIRRGSALSKAPRREKWMLLAGVIVAWLATVAVSAAPSVAELASMDVRFYETGWCSDSGVVEKVAWDFPIFASIAAVVVLYTLLLVVMLYRMYVRQGSRLRDLVIPMRLGLIMLAFLITWMPDGFDHLLRIALDCHYYPLRLMAGSFEILQGFLNCLVYTVANRDVRRNLTPVRMVVEFLVAPLLLIPATIYACVVVVRSSLGVVARRRSPSLDYSHVMSDLPSDAFSVFDEYGMDVSGALNSHSITEPNYPSPNYSLPPIDDDDSSIIRGVDSDEDWY